MEKLLDKIFMLLLSILLCLSMGLIPINSYYSIAIFILAFIVDNLWLITRKLLIITNKMVIINYILFITYFLLSFLLDLNGISDITYLFTIEAFL